VALYFFARFLLAFFFAFFLAFFAMLKLLRLENSGRARRSDDKHAASVEQIIERFSACT
jgi:CBS domain containing-hemolysin-like protein